MGIVALHFEEEEQVILSPSVQVESGDPSTDAIIRIMAASDKTDRESEEGKIFLSLCSLQTELLGLGFPGIVRSICREG